LHQKQHNLSPKYFAKKTLCYNRSYLKGVCKDMRIEILLSFLSLRSKLSLVFLLILSSIMWGASAYTDYTRDLNGLDPVPSGSGKKAYAVRKIVIDPGHGGNDPGAVGLISREKDVVLSISLKLGKMIEAEMQEVQVSYTRKKDEFVELHERAAIANKKNADLFISIHCNAAENKTSFGTETFVLGLHKSKDNLNVAKRENASIYFEADYEKKYEGYDPNSPQGHILLSLFQNAYLDQSIHLAERIESHFVSHNRKSRGVKQDGFLVLKNATMPAVLVEAGFLSHAEEEKWLNSEEGQESIARSIFNSIRQYRENYEVKLKANQLKENQKQDNLVISSPANVSSDEVQILVQYTSSSTRKEEKSPEINKLGQIICREESGLFKYQILANNTLEDASKIKQEIKKIGYKDAFIVAYKNGLRIGLQEALKDQPKIAQVER
jgi:N-acetylmuramoyl-L-alanine amidase